MADTPQDETQDQRGDIDVHLATAHASMVLG